MEIYCSYVSFIRLRPSKNDMPRKTCSRKALCPNAFEAINLFFRLQENVTTEGTNRRHSGPIRNRRFFRCSHKLYTIEALKKRHENCSQFLLASMSQRFPAEKYLFSITVKSDKTWPEIRVFRPIHTPRSEGRFFVAPTVLLARASPKTTCCQLTKQEKPRLPMATGR